MFVGLVMIKAASEFFYSPQLSYVELTLNYNKKRANPTTSSD
ncbi:hypothetical protein LEP1GSC073_3257 [Leptospira noguchii str. Cascata]|nr:hypothetical protein LEP1GSC073_3257 [Leptospira noguchii str. Cascata]